MTAALVRALLRDLLTPAAALAYAERCAAQDWPLADEYRLAAEMIKLMLDI